MLATAPEVASWTLPCRPMSAFVARRLVRAHLVSWGLGSCCDLAELLVSELVTNAVRYACGLVRLRVVVADGLVRCEVEDGAPQLPCPREAADDEEGSRGLALVAGLSRRWGSARTRAGKVVWFEVPVPALDAAA
ncbi:ATP-binding protein [Nonomuraea sp. NPDC050643]|uniref:ATP-binding protein n=1 Tax=Nonomuraea sp. NPDC050643 TaxID=3155660 RepID=UPI00340C4350